MADLARRLVELEAATLQLRAENQELRTELGAARAAPGGGERNPGREAQTEISRIIGKPEVFDGRPQSWKDWHVVMRSYIAATSARLGELTRQAVADSSYVGNELLPDAESTELSAKLFLWLVQTCRGPALDLVVNAGEGNGLEAWRCLVQSYDPKGSSRLAGQLLKLMSWSFAGDVLSRLEAFERELQNYEARSGEAVSEPIRIGMVLNNLPASPLKEHLVFNAGRLEAWPGFRDEIRNVQTAQAAASRAAPMDLGALGKGRGKGKGGKGGAG